MFKLFILFSVIPILELYVIIKVGSFLGAMTTVFIVLITALLGAQLARAQGLLVFRRIQMSLAEGRIPNKELIHGLFILIGGVCLLTPGFVTDIFGLSMLVPFVRDLYTKILITYFNKKVHQGKWTITSSRP